jgi:hypothetical protein
MPVSDLHRQVASAAMTAAAGHGFALAGGNALLAYGIITRPTQDADPSTDQDHGVEQAAATVEAALRQAGFAAERADEFAGLADIFPGMGQGLAEWIITSSGGQELRLQLAYFDRTREPVTMDVGAVLDIEDVAGGKVCALASRVEPRDYADTAAMLNSYTPAELISRNEDLIGEIRVKAGPAFSAASRLRVRGLNVLAQAAVPEKEKVSITLDKLLVDEKLRHGRADSTRARLVP